jgi:tetratricopeptide (TPR) repeat protein
MRFHMRPERAARRSRVERPESVRTDSVYGRRGLGKYANVDTPEKPLCFVLMPFGVKKDPAGGPDIDFDAIYEKSIQPAVESAGMECLRADEERTGGIIHKPMFERLLLCDFALADLTTANPNVFYELGIRHAARPATTLAIFAKNTRLPFDVNFLRALPYDPGPGNAFDAAQADPLKSAVQARLGELRDLARQEAVADSPVYQLLTDFQPPDISRLKTDVFRDRVRYSSERKSALAAARRKGDASGLAAIEASLGDLDGCEAGVLVDLFLSYRAIKAWDRMIGLYSRLPAALQRSTMMREQFALALNRAQRWQEAIEVIDALIQEKGSSSETLGIRGRVYKDLWARANASGNALLAQGYLKQAIDSYRRGFEADWRDAFPGVNTVTLLDIEGSSESQAAKQQLLPIVRFAVEQRLKAGNPDYWDYATLLELAVLAADEQEAGARLSDALAHIREPAFEPESTANNLELIRGAREKRGSSQPWLADAIAALKGAATVS